MSIEQMEDKVFERTVFNLKFKTWYYNESTDLSYL